ncbi:hypothetical protein QBC41DRAFT_262844, partial [Cercophora samala]
MRLLTADPDNQSTQPPHLKLVTFNDSSSEIPDYAILSHTWDDSSDSEVTLQQLRLLYRYPAYSRRLKQTIIVVAGMFGAGLPFLRVYRLGQVLACLAVPTMCALVLASYLALHLCILSAQEEDNPDFFRQKQPGYSKILKTWTTARSLGIKHAWVDTCCIDKTSSAELSESINSMYSYYEKAKVCFVYLYDLEPLAAEDDLEKALAKCRWFTRGWTLQELIAPKHVIFFDKEWRKCGTKESLSGLLSKITGIPEELLRGETTCGDYAVARRMSWASRRQTTREEDTAYCLLGIFGVEMSLLYGEGTGAFQRLQQVILESTADRSIFVWTEGKAEQRDCITNDEDDNDCRIKAANEAHPWSAILAKSPRSFECASHLEASLADSLYRDLIIGPRGIQLVVSLIHLVRKIDEDDGYKCVLDTFCAMNGEGVGVMIRKVSGGRYVRYKPWNLAHFGQGLSREPWKDLNRTLVETATFVTKLETGFPFSKSCDPTLGNRHSALRLRLDKTMPEFTVNQCRAMPRTHWDIHDNVLFATNHISKAWCGFFVHGQLAHTSTTCIPINLFVGCIRWNIKQPFTILASLEDLDPGFRVLLEYQLDRLEFESCRKAEAVMMSVLDGRWSNTTTVVETSVVDKSQIPSSNDGGTVFDGGRIFQTNGPGTSSPSWHYRVPSTGVKVRVEVTLELNEEEDHSICTNTVTTLNLRLKLLEEESFVPSQ